MYPTTRNRQLARIHLLKRDLKLCEDAYRSVLYLLTGKDSAAELDAAERQKTIEFLAGVAKHNPALVGRQLEPVSDEEALEVLS